MKCVQIEDKRDLEFKKAADIDEDEMIDLLEDLHFIDREQKDIDGVRELQQEILKRKLSYRNVITVLCAIQKIVLSWMRLDIEKDKNDVKFGLVSDKGVFQVNDRSVLKLAVKFDWMRDKRQNYLDSIKMQ